MATEEESKHSVKMCKELNKKFTDGEYVKTEFLIKVKDAMSTMLDLEPTNVSEFIESRICVEMINTINAIIGNRRKSSEVNN